MSSSNPPCAACKFLRRKCTQECAYAPYFPPDQPQKFANVHKVFGASNVAKLLNELNADQREDAVNSLVYEADHRLRDPVYGCVGLVSLLQRRLKRIQSDLLNAKKELATYIDPSEMIPILQSPGFNQQHNLNAPSSSTMMPFNMNPIFGLQQGVPHGGQLMIQQYQQQPTIEAQQFAAAMDTREQREMLRNYEQQQQYQQQQQQQTTEAQFAAAMARREQREMLRNYEQQQQYQQQQQQQTIEAQFEAAMARREQREMLRNYEQQQQYQQQQQQHPSQQQDIVRFNSGFDTTGSITDTGFHQMSSPVSALLALDGYYDNPYNLIQQQTQQDFSHPNHHQIHLQPQLLLQQQQHLPQQPETPRQHQRSKSEEGRSDDPSC